MGHPLIRVLSDLISRPPSKLIQGGNSFAPCKAPITNPYYPNGRGEVKGKIIRPLGYQTAIPMRSDMIRKQNSIDSVF